MADKIVNKEKIDIDFKKSRPLYITKSSNYSLVNNCQPFKITVKNISVIITDTFIKFLFYDAYSNGRKIRNVMWFDKDTESIGYDFLNYILFNEAKSNLEFENDIRKILF